MPNNNMLGFDDDDQIEQPLQHQYNLVPAFPDTENRTKAVSVHDAYVVRTAQSRADDELDTLEDMKGSEGIIIRWDLIEKRAREWALNDIRNYKLGELEADERKALKEMYMEEFKKRIKKALSCHAEKSEYIHSEKDSRLHDVAITDRQNAPSIGTDGKIAYHKRDLGVLRVMSIYDMNVEEAIADLNKLHYLTDKYELYYNNVGKEVNWPEEASFSSR